MIIIRCHCASLQIPEVRLLLSRTAYLVTTLRSLHSRLTMVAEDDSVTWSDLLSQVQRYKVLKLPCYCYYNSSVMNLIVTVTLV